VSLDEEDWIHSSDPLAIADDLVAHLCMSIDPHTGATDGPYVLIGSTEYAPVKAMVLAMSLLALAGLAVTPIATFGRGERAESDGGI